MEPTNYSNKTLHVLQRPRSHTRFPTKPPNPIFPSQSKLDDYPHNYLRKVSTSARISPVSSESESVGPIGDVMETTFHSGSRFIHVQKWLQVLYQPRIQTTFYFTLRLDPEKSRVFKLFPKHVFS